MPSGNPKLKFWLSLLIPKIFSYPLGKAKDVKKVIDFFTAAGKPNFSAIGTIPAESAKERNKIKNKYTKRAAVRPQIGGRLKPYGLSIQKDYDFLITRHIGFNSRAPNRSAWRIAWLGGLLGLERLKIRFEICRTASLNKIYCLLLNRLSREEK